MDRLREIVSMRQKMLNKMKQELELDSVSLRQSEGLLNARIAREQELSADIEERCEEVL